MNEIGDEEMFQMMNTIIVLEQQMEFELKVLGSYPDKHDCWLGIELIRQQSIDDEWAELIDEEFSDVGW
jgi:hypothetical protein